MSCRWNVMFPLPSITAVSGTLRRRVVTKRGLSYTTLMFAHADVFLPSVYPALYLSVLPHLLRYLPMVGEWSWHLVLCSGKSGRIRLLPMYRRGFREGTRWFRLWMNIAHQPRWTGPCVGVWKSSESGTPATLVGELCFYPALPFPLTSHPHPATNPEPET